MTRDRGTGHVEPDHNKAKQLTRLVRDVKATDVLAGISSIHVTHLEEWLPTQELANDSTQDP
ncbi:hypothetical protein J6590_057543 [Homalodisca vitripennis]|nr:hypothetical protein J6590_057543 [Homalodisca vitripennis]